VNTIWSDVVLNGLWGSSRVGGCRQEILFDFFLRTKATYSGNSLALQRWRQVTIDNQVATPFRRRDDTTENRKRTVGHNRNISYLFPPTPSSATLSVPERSCLRSNSQAATYLADSVRECGATIVISPLMTGNTALLRYVFWQSTTLVGQRS
jgi:hypothetical protein